MGTKKFLLRELKKKTVRRDLCMVENALVTTFANQSPLAIW